VIFGPLTGYTAASRQRSGPTKFASVALRFSSNATICINRNRGGRSEVIGRGRSWSRGTSDLIAWSKSERRCAMAQGMRLTTSREAAEQMSGVTCGIRLSGRAKDLLSLLGKGSENYLRKVTQWSSPIPMTRSCMMRYFIPCFVRPATLGANFGDGRRGLARRRCVEGDPQPYSQGVHHFPAA